MSKPSDIYNKMKSFFSEYFYRKAGFGYAWSEIEDTTMKQIIYRIEIHCTAIGYFTGRARSKMPADEMVKIFGKILEGMEKDRKSHTLGLDSILSRLDKFFPKTFIQDEIHESLSQIPIDDGKKS